MLIIFLFFLWEPVASAQSISLLVGEADNSNDSIFMEMAMKKHLRADGFEVTVGTVHEGFLVYVSTLPIKTRSGQSLVGYVGNVMIGSLAWSQIVDSLVAPECKISSYQKLKNFVGVDMVYLDSTIAADNSIESLAELMSTYASRVIRKKSQELEVLFSNIEKRLKEPQNIGDYNYQY